MTAEHCAAGLCALGRLDYSNVAAGWVAAECGRLWKLGPTGWQVMRPGRPCPPPAASIRLPHRGSEHR